MHCQWCPKVVQRGKLGQKVEPHIHGNESGQQVSICLSRLGEKLVEAPETEEARGDGQLAGGQMKNEGVRPEYPAQALIPPCLPTGILCGSRKPFSFPPDEILSPSLAPGCLLL